MIYTVTMNPTLDYILTVDHFKAGKMNRSEKEQMLPGGKGINVSTVLTNLGVETKALYFAAGFVGDEIIRMVGESGLNAEAIPVAEGCSRINVKVLSEEHTEINSKGPVIGEEPMNRLYECLDHLQEGDFLVLAGSVPASLPGTVYRDILKHVEGKGVRTVVDATGDLLRETLSCHPFLIKPNQEELEDFFLVKINDKDEAVPYAKRLQEMGAQNVLVSMAGEGAILIEKDGTVSMLPAPAGDVVNSVGAGDAMVAGFLTGWLESGEAQTAFRMGLAAGSASAFSDVHATKEEILKVYETVEDK